MEDDDDDDDHGWLWSILMIDIDGWCTMMFDIDGYWRYNMFWKLITELHHAVYKVFLTNV